MSEHMTAEREAHIRQMDRLYGEIRQEGAVFHRRQLLRELDATRAERDAVSIPEYLAADVLDEIEAAIAAGRAMGHGAWAILNRVRRLLQPQLRADASRFLSSHPEAP